jgi:hypothetical protein
MVQGTGPWAIIIVIIVIIHSLVPTKNTLYSLSLIIKRLLHYTTHSIPVSFSHHHHQQQRQLFD